MSRTRRIVVAIRPLLILGEVDLATALQAAQQAHRNYAKRQMTRFRREPDVVWLAESGKPGRTPDHDQAPLPRSIHVNQYDPPRRLLLNVEAIAYHEGVAAHHSGREVKGWIRQRK